VRKLDEGQEKELAIKATVLLYPELKEEVLRDHWKHAQFVNKKIGETFAYLKTVEPRERNAIVMHLISELVLPISKERRRGFLCTILSNLDEHNDFIIDGKELMKRLKEHQEADNVTRKENRTRLQKR